MARSFFERLTGSIRANSDDADGSVVERKAAPFPAQKPRKRAAEPEPEEESRVLHPVAADGGEARETEESADEEGQLTVDIYDDGQNIVIQSAVAGVKPEDIDISLQEQTLTIRSSRKRQHEVRDENFYYKELFWGAFSRSIILPEEVDFQKAEAAMKHGLLTIKLPKKDKGEKKIRVKIGD